MRGAVGGVGRDVSEVRHRVQHDVAPLAAPRGLRERRERRRRLDDAGDRRGFGERQVADVLAEEQTRRLRDAGDRERSALPERDVVQVHLEDVVLRRAPCEHDGDPRFEHLAAQRLLARRLERHARELRQEHVAHQLLRNRAAAGHVRLRAAQVRQERADDADRIDARVVVEPVILDRQHRVDHLRRNHRQRDLALLLALAADERRQHRRVERQLLARSSCRARGASRGPAVCGGFARAFGVLGRRPRRRGFLKHDANGLARAARGRAA